MPFCEPLLHGNPAPERTHAMNTKPPISQESDQRGQAIANLIDDIHDLPGKLDSVAWSFTLARRQHPDHQRQHSPFNKQSERTTP